MIFLSEFFFKAIGLIKVFNFCQHVKSRDPHFRWKPEVHYNLNLVKGTELHLTVMDFSVKRLFNKNDDVII